MISEEPGLEHPPLHDLHLRAQRGRLRTNAADHHIRRLARRTLDERDQDHRLFGHQARTAGAHRQLRLTLHHRGLFALHPALDLRLGRAPYDEHVVEGAGVDQRLAQSLIQHQYGGEDIHDQRQASRSERSRHLAGGQIARNVGERNAHHPDLVLFQCVDPSRSRAGLPRCRRARPASWEPRPPPPQRQPLRPPAWRAFPWRSGIPGTAWP